MFLLSDASGGSNSRLFVVPPLLRLLRVAALLCAGRWQAADICLGYLPSRSRPSTRVCICSMPSLQWHRSATSRSSLHSMRKTRWPWLRMTSTRCKCSLLSGRSFHSSCNFVSQQTSFLRIQDRHSFVMKVPFVEWTLVVFLHGRGCEDHHRRLLGWPALPRFAACNIPSRNCAGCHPHLLCAQDAAAHRRFAVPSCLSSTGELCTSTKWRTSTNHLPFEVWSLALLVEVNSLMPKLFQLSSTHWQARKMLNMCAKDVAKKLA